MVCSQAPQTEENVSKDNELSYALDQFLIVIPRTIVNYRWQE